MSGYTDLLLVIGTFVAVTVTIVVGYYTVRYQRKETDLDSMKYVFELLDPDQKSLEYALRDYYVGNTLYENDRIRNTFVDMAAKVWRNYDQIGLFFKNGLLPRNDYCKMFGKITVVYYFILKKEIDARRKDAPDFMYFFKELALDCWYYWSRQGKPILKPNSEEPISIYDLTSET